MIGFEVTINNQPPLLIAAERHVFIRLCNRNGKRGLDDMMIRGWNDSEMFYWIDRKPQKGDRVRVRVVEIESASPAQETQKKDREKMKERYEQLKKELTEQGLL